MIKCGECGFENMDGLDYCDGCGAKLAAAPAEAAPASAESAPAPPSERSAAASAIVDVVPAAAMTEEPAASKVPTGEMKAPAPEAPPASAAAAALLKAKLAIIRGTVPERRGIEFPLEAGNNLIGRWDPETGSFPEVDLEQDDPEAKISRKHALIRIDGGKITLEDIGSLNGTYVNRQPRLQPGTPIDLKDGDEIIVGKTFFKLTVSPIS
jgi:hypothetical protein